MDKNSPNRGKFILDRYTCPEFEYLKDFLWEFDEKVDGTNIRIGFDGKTVVIGGRTDRAQIPKELYECLTGLFTLDKLKQTFPYASEESYVVLYGEGYGRKIQKGGSEYISDGVNFILFDVLVGNIWLLRDSIENIGDTLEIKFTPMVGEGTIADGIKLCKDGFKSQLRDNDPEGIILRPKVRLNTRTGARIITKLKLCDFE